MDKTFEDILREKMRTPVALKNQPGATVMPLEAMAMSVMNNAMKGDIPSIAFINNLTKQREDDTPEHRSAQEKLFRDKCAALQRELEDEELWLGQQTELEQLARQALAIDRVGALMEQQGHRDVEEKTLRDGSQQIQLSTVDRIYLDLCKQFRQDLKDFKVAARIRRNSIPNTKRKK